MMHTSSCRCGCGQKDPSLSSFPFVHIFSSLIYLLLCPFSSSKKISRTGFSYSQRFKIQVMEDHSAMLLLLFKAAREGNTVELLRLLEADPLILERVFATESPLHIASMVGHVVFVRELMKHKSNNLKDMNQLGFSPLHLASANGHTEVVKELLKASKELSSLKGRDGLSPLHCASINGRVGAIVELLDASPASPTEVTLCGETCVHLAVKKNQLESLRTLVDGIKLSNMLSALNLKDVEGNTALHLAAATRNHLAIEVLLCCNGSEDGGEVVQVNARNKNGLTALDLAIICSCSCSCGDQYHSQAKTERLLVQAGARRANWVLNQNQNHQVPAPNIHSRKSSNTWCADQEVDMERPNRTQPQYTLVVALTLIAVATYQAMLSPPCGIQENGPQFIWFVLCNSTGFFISIATMWVMVQKSPWCLGIYVATFGLVCCYQCAVYIASPAGELRNVAICICVSLPFLPYIALQLKNLRLFRLKHKSHELV